MNKALYAGSFDPLTNGHLDLIKRASHLCNNLVIGVITNPSKTPAFTAEERKEMIETATAHLSNVKVDIFSGLLADYVNANGFDVVLRGLRSSEDFETEMQMAQMNARIYQEKVETIFLMTNPRFSFLSSSMIKEVCSLGGDVGGLVPENILRSLEKKYNR